MNAADFIVIGIIAALAAVVIFIMIRNKKKGKGCGCGCENCAANCEKKNGK